MVHWLAKHTDLRGVVWTSSAHWATSISGKVQFAKRRLKRVGLLKTIDEAMFYALSKNVLNDTGEATVNVSRFPTTGGVTGSGSIVTLVFQAVGHGETLITVPQLVLRNSQSQPILTASPQLAVTVK